MPGRASGPRRNLAALSGTGPAVNHFEALVAAQKELAAGALRNLSYCALSHVAIGRTGGIFDEITKGELFLYKILQKCQVGPWRGFPRGSGAQAVALPLPGLPGGAAVLVRQTS